MNVAVSWYQKDEWEKMKALSVDAETLDDDYESWKKNANSLIASLKENGVVAQKFSVNAEKLLAWCQEQGRPLNGKARSAYAVHILQQRHEKSTRGET